MNVIPSYLRILSATLVLLYGPMSVVAAPDDVEPVPARADVNDQFNMNEEQFEANLFNPHGNAKQARTAIETRLTLQLNELNRICELNETQKQKLKLAAGSDVKRFFDEIEVVRKKFRDVKNDQNAWNQIWQDIQPLQVKMSTGLFAEKSFFAKTVRTTLSDDQLAKYTSATSERRQFRYRACIEVVLSTMESSVPLRHSQHEALARILFEETQPPASFGQYDQYVVMYHLAMIPESRIKSLLDERQWKLLQGQLDQHRGMEQFLIQNGLITKANDEINVPKVRVRRQPRTKDTPADAAEPENRVLPQPVP